MPKVYVYDSYDNKFFRYTLRENDPMPYSTDTTLRVREFRGSSKSNVLWTTTAAMEAWNLTRRTYGSGIPVGYAFKRIWEGGHGTTSQHYAGVAFDVGQSSTAAKRRKIYNAAVRTGAWGYVEPLSMTPTWVHFDRRYGKPACRSTTAGYPTVRRGSRSTYVLILQDALNALGYTTNTLDGIFGHATENALKACQRRFGLTADGVCGCASWEKRSPRRRWGSAKRRRLLILDLSAGIIKLASSQRGPRSCTILYKEVFPHGYAGDFCAPAAPTAALNSALLRRRS